MAGQIIAIGGGGFGRNPKEPIIEDYIVNTASSKKPKVTFFPTASAENKDYIVNFYNAFSRLDCTFDHISLFQNTPNLDLIIDQSDIIYIGGGNTKSMLSVFREWKLDQLLIKSYNDGKLLCGVSAGAICWFEKGITDSWEGDLRMLDCLNILPGVCCPHYDGEVKRKPSVKKFIENNQASSILCIEDGAAIHYEGKNIKKAISFYPNKNVYDVSMTGDSLIEKSINKIDISK